MKTLLPNTCLTSLLVIAYFCLGSLNSAHAQQTFDPANPPRSSTPPTEIYHHWVNTEYPIWHPENTSHQKGPKTVLVIMVRPSDGPVWASPPTFQTLDADLDDASQHYYNASYHQTWFGPKHFNGHDIPRLVVTPILDLPGSADYYRNSFGMLQQHCFQAVRAQGGEWNGGSLDPNNFDRIVPMSNVKMISSTGLAYVGGRFAWVGTSLTGGVTLHEWGHNWGVYHANSWDVPAGEHPRSSLGSNGEYQDGWCVMGGSHATMFNPHFRIDLKFLERSRGEALDVTTSGTYRIHDYVHPDCRQPASLVRALVIPMTSFTDPKRLILGFGHNGGTDGGFGRSDYNRNAVTVHTKFTEGSQRLDTTPGSRPGSEDRNDSSIKIGRTYSEGPNVNGTQLYGGFHITPVSRGNTLVNGQSHEWIDVVINYENSISNNQPPVASFDQTLITDAQPGVPYQITVNTSDPNGDALAYDWDFGDDTYNIVNSTTQTKTWETAGIYLVRATVSDMKGGLATALVWVNVGNVPFRTPENPTQTVGSLNYSYYHGVYNSLPDWNKQIPVKQGTVSTFSIDPRTRNNNYGFVYEGFVEIPTSDVYTFTLSSRDGSRLWIGDTQVINNDGLKPLASPTAGNIALSSGKHRIRVEMFNRDGNGSLQVQWSTLSTSSVAIPASALSRTDPASFTPPSVSLTSPEANMSTIVGSDVTLSATASSPLGISRVAFYIGDVYLGDDTSLPYSVNWTNVPVGSFNLSAVAYDTAGNFLVSSPVLFNVVSPMSRDIIGINFVGRAGTNGTLATSDQAGAFYMHANWNNAPQGTYGQTWDATVSVLKDQTGQPTTAWTRYRSKTHSSYGATASSADFSTPNGRLMRGGLMVRHDDRSPEVEVYDIPFSTYDVYVYFDVLETEAGDRTAVEYTLTPGGQSARPSVWGHNSLVTGDGMGDYPNYDTWVGFKESTAIVANADEDLRLGNYIVFREVNASSFHLIAKRVNTSVSINAIQIVNGQDNPSEPLIYSQPQSLVMPETRTATFTVKYVGFPQPTVEWFKVGQGSLGVTSDSLVIPFITPSEAGGYYAVVTNTSGTATSNTATLTVTDPPPNPPSELVATALSTSEIQLSWTDNSGDEDGFTLYRSTSENGPWVQIHTTGANNTSYLDGQLTESTTYYYRISAFNHRGESNPSNIASDDTLTNPRPVTILTQPTATSIIVGGTATLTVEVDGYPEPEFQWMKDGVDIPGAVSATFTLSNAAFSDQGNYTVRAYNMHSEATSQPVLIAVGQPLPFAINPLYVIHVGSVATNNGIHTMTRSGTDAFQGVVSNFMEIVLANPGDYIELTFTLQSNTSNNAARSISFGIFNGPVVTANGQTSVTDLWQGYLHQPGSRSSSGNPSYGLARQGQGPAGLMDYAAGTTAMDGISHSLGMSGFNQSVPTPVTVRLERISETQIRLRSVFTTPDTNRSGSNTNNGIVWSYNTASGVCTTDSTFPAADGPTAFNAFAIATRGNWTLQNLALATNVALVPPAPANLSASVVSSSQIQLTWTDNAPNETNYVIERSLDGVSFSPLHTTAADVTTYADSDLTPGTAYHYRVKATNAVGDSPWSGPASATSSPPASGFAAWQTAQFPGETDPLIIGPNADPDGDGILNLLEYALTNGDPLTPGSANLPQVGTTTIAENDYLTLTIAKNPNATDVTYIVESSTDLSTWQSGEGNTVIVSETASELIVRTAAPVDNDSRRFLRLRVMAQ